MSATKPSASTTNVEAALERSVQAINIPPRPAILQRIMAEIDEYDPDLEALGKLISADVALAAGLIKTANSPFFGFGNRARSVHSALLLLGLDAICHAVAAISLRRAFPNSTHYERFWDSSAKIAALSRWLAKRLPASNLRTDDAYTFGLFRDCGIVVLLRQYPDYAKTLTMANQESDAAFTAVELRQHPTDHTVVGCLLAQNWWLPDVICQAIRHHHNPTSMVAAASTLPAASSGLIAVGQTAEFLLQSLTGECQTQEWPKLGAACLSTLQLTENDVSWLVKDAGEVLAQID
jgi:HD-like signal output (HDOD) protein